jgi:hypothetical protein
MSTVRLLTFATDPNGYYNILLQSAQKNGYEVKTLGMGQKWGGLMTKYQYTNDYIQSLPESQNDDVIVFLDGYDTFVLQEKDNLMDRYNSFGKPLVFSTQWNRKNSDKFTHFLISTFSSGHKDVYNSGAYMGPVWALKEKFKLICNVCDCNMLSLNDQKELNRVRNIKPEFFEKYTAVDKEGYIFMNASYYSCAAYGPILRNIPWFTDIDVEKKNGQIINKNTGIEPIFISGPGNVNLEPFILYKGYEQKDIITRDSNKFLLGFIKEYPYEFLIYYGTLGLVAGITLYFIIKLLIKLVINYIKNETI